MSDLMDRAVIGMPFDMAMRSHLSRLQFYNRAQAILAERDALLAERDAAFAAGQEEMRERAAAEISDWDLASMSGINDPEDKITDYVVATLRDLPIKGRP